MINQKLKLLFFVFLLSSTALFPTAHLAYAQGPLVVTLAESPRTLDQDDSFSTILIESGATLIIGEGVIIEANGKMDNYGTFIINGDFKKHGPIWNYGDFEIRCGTFNEDLPPVFFLAIPNNAVETNCESGTNVLPDLIDATISKDQPIHLVKSGKVQNIYGTLNIFGIFQNQGTVHNYAEIEVHPSSQLLNTGEWFNHCANLGVGVSASSEGEIQLGGTVTPIDCKKPIAVDDSYDVDEDNPNDKLFSSVLTNDRDSDSDVTESIITADTDSEESGTVVMNTDGTFEYYPVENFFGFDTFEYTLTDETGGISEIPAIVTIEVLGVNDDPTAVNDPPTSGDTISIDENSIPITIDVLDNDTILPDIGETLTIIDKSQGVNGGIVVITNSGTDLTYTPELNYSGDDSFTYTISDGNEGTSTATVNINVVINNPPNITLNGLASITLEVGQTYEEEGATCTDIENGSLQVNIAGDMVDTNYPDVYRVTYDCEDLDGKDATRIIRTITVVTNDPPLIVITGSETVTVTVGDIYIDEGATYSDTEDTLGVSFDVVEGGNVDPNGVTTDIIDNVDTAIVNTYTVVYSAIDSDINPTEVTRIVNVVANSPPLIVITGSETVTVTVGDIYIDEGATYSDTEDTLGVSFDVVEGGNVDPNGVTTDIIDNVDTAIVNTYTVVYSAIDSDGSSITETRTVNVIESLNDSLRDQKISEIMDLENLINESTDKKTKDEINKALKDLNKSVEIEKWEDNGNYLIDNKGKKVFDEEQKGIKHLIHILDKDKEQDEFLLKVTTIILNLVDIDDQLAGLEYAAAVSSGAEQKCLDNADKENPKIEKEEAKGKYDKAVDHLGHLWEKSLKCQGIDIGGYNHGPK